MRDPGAFLAARRRAGLLRSLRTFEPAGGGRVRASGEALSVFCSNDYLGLANDPRPARAMADAAGHGAGSGAAHLISGHRREHDRLERALAEFLERDRVLLFSTGYMANLGVIDALCGRGDTVVGDRLNHASLLDGARLAGARSQRYPHGDVRQARDRLTRARGTRLLTTDGVFSMDGDIARLPELAAAARTLNATLVVDDAHGIGVLGPRGGGSVAEAALDQTAVPVLIGTLGKAFGVFGAFVAGAEELVEYLLQTARTYVYTTAMPPAVAAGASVSLAIAETEEWRREKLVELIQRFRAGARARGLELMPSRTPIQPLRVGDAERAMAWSRALEERGYLVTAIRPPTVARGSARLRITLSAAHEPDDVNGLLTALDASREAIAS